MRFQITKTSFPRCNSIDEFLVRTYFFQIFFQNSWIRIDLMWRNKNHDNLLLEN